MLDPHKLARDCIMDAPPPCSAACPIGVDVRDLVERIRIGSHSAACKVYAKSAIFPGIACHLCPRPCEQACPRGELDQSIRLLEIEKFLWRQSQQEPQRPFFIPDKKKRVLVIGAGLAGMSIALKLAQRGYFVTLAEQSPRAGGALWAAVEDGRLPAEALQEAVATLGAHKFIELLPNRPVTGPVEGYDATLLCTGPGTPPLAPDPAQGLFAMGGARDPGQDFMACLREAGDMLHAVEQFVKVGRAEPAAAEGPAATFWPNLAGVGRVPAAVAHGEPAPTAEQAAAEAARCLRCTCSNCVDVCEMLQFYGKSPKKTIEDLSDTLNKTPLVQKTALRQIMSCTQCGLCSNVCPAGIDFKAVCLESRGLLHGLGLLPGALYDYWLEDMAFSNGEEAALLLAPARPEDTRYLLFPGCQLAASDPGYVTAAQGWLEGELPGAAALLTGCCGAPAYWAGDRALHAGALARIRAAWEGLGRPTLLLPCPTCLEMFSLHLPDLPALSLWAFMAARIEPAAARARGTVSIFDPCSSKYAPDTQQAVRALAEGLGYTLEELPHARETAACCGHGGLIYTTSAELYGRVRAGAAGAGDRPYLTYCVNCRDSFAAEGKPAVHLLDALFFPAQERFMRPAPDLSARRDNRRRLKNQLGKERQRMDSQDIRLEIGPALRATLNRRLIHEDNLKAVIGAAEQSGKKVRDSVTGHCTAHAAQGRVTFWAEYEPLGAGVYRLHDAYAHRMVIEE